MNPLLWIASAAAGLVAIASAKKASAQTPAEPAIRPCDGPAPGAFPAMPAGFKAHSGPVTQTARAAARAALSGAFGSFSTFTDEDGATRGVLLTWHCHNPEEGVKPVGWHKGATLLDQA